MNSGEAARGRSNFSRTCSLLGRYLKENRGSVGISLGHKEMMRETLDLLPKVDKSGRNSPHTAVNREQMTIFYGGRVLVLHDFPADKANEVMTLAAGFSAAAAISLDNILPAFEISEQQRRPSLLDLFSDLPIPRKHSLARFLARRKDRILAAGAPYRVVEPIRDKSWLELALH